MFVFMSVAKEIPYYLDEAREEILPHRAIDELSKALDELNRAAQAASSRNSSRKARD